MSIFALVAFARMGLWKESEKIVQKVEARKATGLETTIEELRRIEATKKG